LFCHPSSFEPGDKFVNLALLWKLFAFSLERWQKEEQREGGKKPLLVDFFLFVWFWFQGFGGGVAFWGCLGFFAFNLSHVPQLSLTSI
jgi:hypothetical protein